MRIATVIGTISLALLGRTAFAQDVAYDYDKTTDFSRFRTYAWVRGHALSDELNHKRIVTAVDSQLASRHLRPAQPGETPDLLVAYHASFDRDLQISASGWGGYRIGGSRSGSARAEEIVRGTLVVDLVDASTRTIVWRGVATRDVDLQASPEKREKNINKAAAKLFKHYPPGQ
jgi:hypothetical protein